MGKEKQIKKEEVVQEQEQKQGDREEIKISSEVVLEIIKGSGFMPEYSSDQASGADLKSSVEVLIPPGERVLVSTGIRLGLPEGFEVQIRPRSGLALNEGITVLNTPGTIDSDYRGEIGVILINHSRWPYKVHRGDRIAQAVVVPVFHAIFEEVESLEKSCRNEDGFGSTGV